MSTLNDLPRELIERIFLFEESVRLTRQAYEGYGDPNHVPVAPVFRLVNQYIERCTRLIFAKTFFRGPRIKLHEEASIKMFCDIARLPDLVKYVIALQFCVSNNQHGRLEISSTTRIEIVDALRACPGNCELMFCDSPREVAASLQRQDATADDLDSAALVARNTIDMSLAFSFVLSAAAEAGMRPKWISTWTCKSGACHSLVWQIVLRLRRGVVL